MDRGAAFARGVIPVAGGLAVGIVALALRLHAVNVLPVDFDEDDYLRAGQQYAVGLQTGDLGVFMRDNYRTEHPELSKIVTGLAIAPLPPAPEIPDRPTTAPPATDLPADQLTAARAVQAVFGALTALALGFLSPIGGLWLAIHTWSIKYSSQVMLESVPAFFALVSVLAWTAARRAGVAGGPDDETGAGRDEAADAGGTSQAPRRFAGARWGRFWLILAAIAFGLACGGKYLYGVAGLAILADWLWRTRPETWRRPAALARWLAPALGWILVAVIAFLAVNPYLWPDPIGRLADSIRYHGGYATSQAVENTGWPTWQPLVWLMGSVPFHPTGTFLIAIDLPITILAAVGLRRMWARRRVFALWLLIAFAFLVVWPTKWPQYLLVLSAPLSLSAGYGARMALEPVGRWARRRADAVLALLGRRPDRGVRSRGRGFRGGLGDLRAAAPWLLPGIIGFVLFAVIPIGYEFLISVTDMSLPSIRDGISGGVVREAVGGLTGQIPAVPFNINSSAHQVHYVGDDLLAGFQSGFWLGGNTSAMYPAFSLLWMILSVGLQATLGIAVAIVLERPGVRFAGWWRTLFILPWAIPEVVGAVAWRDVFYPERGLLAQLVGGSVNWTANPDVSLLVLLLVSTWMGWPLWMLVATAGLRTIPAAVHEAAQLDGAGRWRMFRTITLPLLLPVLGAAFIVRGIAAFNQFYLFWVMGPSDATTTLSTFSFFVFTTNGGPGLFAVSAAINIITLLGLAAIVVWFFRWRARAERVAFV